VLNGGQGQPDQYLRLVRWAARRFFRRHGSGKQGSRSHDASARATVGRRGRASSAPGPR
jgi:hypothetical protein